MKKKWLLFGFVFYLLLVNQEIGYAQNKKVRYIQDFYYYVKDKISKEHYYINEYQFNSTGKKLPKKGEHKRMERYFYSFSGKSQPKIRTITIKTTVGRAIDYEEFLYDLDGQLILYYEKRNDKAKLYGEISIYFNKGVAIHIIKDRKVFEEASIDQSENFVKNAWTKGTGYHKRFDAQVKLFNR